MELVHLNPNNQGLINSVDKNTKKKQIATILLKVNTILAFKIEDTEIWEWSDVIYQTNPNANLKHIEFAIFMYQIGDFTWDRYIGIQNIIKALNDTQELLNWINKLSVKCNTLSELRFHYHNITKINNTIPQKFRLDEKYKYFSSRK